MNPSEKIKLIREKLDLSQAKFGESIGVNQKKIADIEIGRQRVTPEIAKAVEDIYKINLRWLLFDEENMYINGQEETIRSLNELKEKYNLNDKELELISELLTSPEKRQAILRFLEDFKNFDLK
ncbi:MAG: hypothetical protein ACD_20C00047G0002 [uncultured bacterium]|nr:MAG: hypothetical protein ACD_20C00047G0002 [uncultured bacterium]